MIQLEHFLVKSWESAIDDGLQNGGTTTWDAKSFGVDSMRSLCDLNLGQQEGKGEEQ